ncbi:phage tail assembly chaperone G [Listeria monocytogenes]
MEIRLMKENEKQGVLYKKNKPTMFDAMTGMEYNVRQSERFAGKDEMELTNTHEGIMLQMEATKDAANFLVTVFDNQFSVDDVLKGLTREDFASVVNSVLFEVMGGDTDETKKEQK